MKLKATKARHLTLSLKGNGCLEMSVWFCFRCNNKSVLCPPKNRHVSEHIVLLELYIFLNIQ